MLAGLPCRLKNIGGLKCLAHLEHQKFIHLFTANYRYIQESKSQRLAANYHLASRTKVYSGIDVGLYNTLKKMWLLISFYLVDVEVKMPLNFFFYVQAKICVISVKDVKKAPLHKGGKESKTEGPQRRFGGNPHLNQQKNEKKNNKVLCWKDN